MASDKKARLLLSPGQTLNRFIIHEYINRGAYGQVFAATDKSLDRPVAVKVEPTGVNVPQLENEARILYHMTLYAASDMYGLRRCEHIPSFIEYGEGPDFRYMVMERCGENLRDLKKKTPRDRFTLYTSLWLLQKMISAIQYLHSLQILHGDVKPNNFCVGIADPRQLLLIDYGLARNVEEENRKTKTHFNGTVRYASPNAHKRKPLTKHDDLWSIYYATVENIVGSLPWKNIEDKEQVAKMKEATDLLSLDFGAGMNPPVPVVDLAQALKERINDPNAHLIQPQYNDVIYKVEMDKTFRQRYTVLDWQTLPKEEKPKNAGDWFQHNPPAPFPVCPAPPVPPPPPSQPLLVAHPPFMHSYYCW